MSQVFRTRNSVVHALSDITLTVGAGEFVSLVGPSGCGKSTLLMALAGLQQPASGSIRIDGELVKGPSPLMGIAFQRDNLLEWRTVLANVLVQAELRGLGRERYRERASRLLDMVGLAGFERSYPRELSGGMRQRVALCRAILHSPSLLLMDEPFGAVDAMTREQLHKDVGTMCAATGVTAMLVTHDINEAVFMSDRVCVMTPRPGRIAAVIEVAGAKPRDTSFRSSPEFVEAGRAIRAVLESGAALTGARSA
ncbi:MAG TPA: ABC transporter ATP-binding protein [Trebonia sp.]|nr:ABC transporter ATP-binding protein [Trebonia sp.]